MHRLSFWDGSDIPIAVELRQRSRLDKIKHHRSTRAWREDRAVRHCQPVLPSALQDRAHAQLEVFEDIFDGGHGRVGHGDLVILLSAYALFYFQGFLS